MADNDLFAPPSDDEIAAAKKVKSDADLYAPPTPNEVAPEKEGPFAAGISGVAHGLTLGQSDKILAGARAATGAIQGEGKLGDLYDKYLAEGQQRSENLEKENPMSYTAGNLGGAVASPINRLIPGASLEAGLATKGVGNLAKNVAQGAALGGVTASGASHAHPTESYEQFQKFLDDVTHGAEGGAVGGTLATAAGTVAGAIPQATKSAMSVMLGAPEDAVDRLIANPRAVQSSPGVVPTVDKIKSQVANLKAAVVKESELARQDLTDEGSRRFTGNEIANFFLDAAHEIEARSQGALTRSQQATVDYLEKEAQPFLQRTTRARLFDGSRVKDLIQELDRKTENAYGLQPGEFAKPDEQTLKEIRYSMDQQLKQNPQYAASMSEVSRKMRLLDDAQSLFRSDQGLANTLERVRREKAPFAEKVFNDLDTEFGTTTVEDLRNALAREAFEKGAQGPGGSHMVQLWKAVTEKNLGDMPGAIAGATVNRYGPSKAKTLIEMSQEHPERLDQLKQLLDQSRYGSGATINPVVSEYLGKKYSDKKRAQP